jgi:hypothetical protein
MKLLKVLFLALLFPLLSTAQSDHDFRIEKRFNTNDYATLRIQNSFGKVRVTQHGGTDIDVVVTISLDVKNQEKRKELISKISVETIVKGNIVELITQNKLNGDRNVKSFSIDYDVRVPADLILDIDNKFGDVIVGNLDAKLMLKVQHGSAFIENLGHQGASLKVQFGALKCSSLINSVVMVQHGDLDLGTFDGGSIHFDFSKGDVASLKGEVEIDVQHSTLTVDALHVSMAELDLKAAFSSIELGGALTGPFAVELDGMFCNFEWSGDANVRTEDRGFNRDYHVINAQKGQVPSRQQVRVDAKHSTIRLR